MDPTLESPLLISRLEELRRSVRRRLIAYGLCAVAAGGVVALLTIITVDRFLLLPAVLRILVSLFFVAGFVGATHRWILRPLRAELGLLTMAAQVERRFPELGERLSSTVQLAEQAQGGSTVLIARALEEAGRLAGSLAFRRVLSLRPVAGHAALLALSGVALAVLFRVAPTWLETGLRRYLNPFGPTQWPTRVALIAETADVRVAIGEPVTLRMRVERGRTERLRGLVRLREADGAELIRTMNRDAQGRFEVILDAVTSDFEYWFEAGDATTAARPGRVTVARRPEVVEARALVEPPAYARRRGPRLEALGEAPLRAPLGGAVTVTVKSSKPLSKVSSVGTLQPSELVSDAGERLPLTVGEDPREASATLTVSRDWRFRVELRDEEGFSGRGSNRYAIQAVPDRPPAVAFLEPTHDAELTPRGSLPLVIRAADDFGLTDLRLRTVRQLDGQSYEIPMDDAALSAPDQDANEITVEYVWNAAGLFLSPGDVLVQTVEATDAFRSPELPEGQVGRSDPLRVRIISDAEFGVRLRDDWKLIQDHFRAVALDQAAALDEANALLGLEAGGAPAAKRQAALEQSVKQDQLVHRAAEGASRLEKLAARVLRNGYKDQPVSEALESQRESAREIVQGAMSESAAHLGRAAQAADGDEQQTALAAAAREDEDAVRRLLDLVQRMTQWGTWQQTASRTRDLLDRQEGLHTQTVKLGQSTLGRGRDALTPDEAAALLRAQRQQEQLADDVEQHLAHLREMLGASASGEPERTAPIEAALRAAQAGDLSRRMAAAVEALSANRTSSATLEQKAAAQSLRAMIDAFEQKDRRDLENLRKELADAAEQIARLLREQRTLRDATLQAVAAQSDSSSLSPEQHRVAVNTRLLTEELAETPRVAPAARFVADAVPPMNQAEESLRTGAAARGADLQGQAMDSLQAALDRLEDIEALLAEESLLQSLAEIEEELNAIRSAQTEIQERLTILDSTLRSAGRLGRKEAREAAQLAQQQHDNRGRTESLAVQLEKVVVYRWILRRAADWMETVRGHLDGRRINEETVAMGERIVRELQKLTLALQNTRQLAREPEFAETETEGGGGGGQQFSGKPLPTLSELLVLKTVQVELQERTRTLHESLDADNPTQRQLRELAELGEDQRELRRLTEEVVHGAKPERESP